MKKKKKSKTPQISGGLSTTQHSTLDTVIAYRCIVEMYLNMCIKPFHAIPSNYESFIDDYI